MKVLAIDDRGILSYCSSPIEKRGKGRCRHVVFKEDLQTEQEFREQNASIITKDVTHLPLNRALIQIHRQELVYSAGKYEIAGLTMADTKRILEELKGKESDDKCDESARIISSLNHEYERIENNNLADCSNLMEIMDLNLRLDKGDDWLRENYKRGEIRSKDVIIGGTHYRPGHITNEDCYQHLQEINKISTKKKALSAFSIICREQWFNNCNKRTATLVANYILANHNCGIFCIPTDDHDRRDFTNHLLDYYEDDNLDKFIRYLSRTCILKE